MDLLRKHPERLRPFHPDTAETRTPRFLVEARREAVEDKTRYLNRLIAQLKTFFPQVPDWFSTAEWLSGWARVSLLFQSGLAGFNPVDWRDW